jgi:hypothetical protein
MRRLAAVLAGMAVCSGVAVAGKRDAVSLAAAESAYADAIDALGIASAIESGLFASYRGRTYAEWEAAQRASSAEFARLTREIEPDALGPEDSRALANMRRRIGALTADDSASLAPRRRCGDARSATASYDVLRTALYACFDELGNAIEFEGERYTRVAALGMLSEIDDPVRRKRLFTAFVPLWQAVNADNSPSSPYRRAIAFAAAEARRSGSEIDAAARTLGVEPAEVARWLERILDAWRRASGDEPVEPWDYRYRAGEADRILRTAIPRRELETINRRYYADLGANLEALGARYDLEPRAGKAPLAYADFVTRGRVVDGRWRPTVVRVSGSYGTGGLGLLNELVHENGHVVHMMAVRTRPAFMDLGDGLFIEAFADVPSWNTYEPAWQHRYLGRAVPESMSLRALYSGVMLDAAWALFESRLLRDPALDPNAVWTEITSRYLRVVPHPELAWWAVRVQLVDSPGYMVNYGLGAVLTAGLRGAVTTRLGDFRTGRPDWYAWLSRELLQYGESVGTRELLRRFLGRPVSPEALLGQIARLDTRTSPP